MKGAAMKKAKKAKTAQRTTKSSKTVKRGSRKPAAAALLASSAALPPQAGEKRARLVVADVFDARFGAKNVPDNTPLAKFGLNGMNLPGIAANIRQRKIDVSNAAIQGCGVYGCIVTATAAARIIP
jgi:hypothetical protein